MSNLRIVRGNTFWTRTTVTAKDYEGHTIQDFGLSQSTDVVVIIRTAYRNLVMSEWSITGNDLEIKWKGIPIGRYGLDVSGIYNGIEWRFFTENVLDIVNSNAEANIPANTIIQEDFYAIDGVTMMVTQVGGGSSVQSDWEEDDTTDPAYIKNKPNLGSYALTSDIPTKVSQLTNDAGYLTSFTETDPTVPSWAKAETKPTYTAEEVGALPADTTIPDAQIQSDWEQTDSTKKDFIKNKPSIPAAQVQSDWNASSGMGAILNKPTIPTVPTNVSSFTNDAEYQTFDDVEQALSNVVDSNLWTMVNSSGPLRGNYINPSSTTNWTTSTTYRGRVTTFSQYAGKKILIVNTSNVTPCRYAFLKLDSTSGKIYYCDDTTLYSSSEDIISVTVPITCSYLYIFAYDNGTFLSHTIFVEEKKSDLETSDSFTTISVTDLTQISERPCSLGINVWYRASNNTGAQRHKPIPVVAGEYYRITSSGYTGYYGFLTSSYSPTTTYKNNNTIPYVDGTNRLSIPDGVPTSIQIPTGCAYLVINTVDGSNNSPTWKVEKGFTCKVIESPFKVRVASWNIGGFSLGESGSSTITHEQYPTMRQKWAEAINGINADIFCCCEYNENMVNAEGSLAAIKARDAIFSLYPNAYEGDDYNYMCTAIMSNYQVEGVAEAFYLNTVVSNRYYQYGCISLGNEKVVIVITHLDNDGHGAQAATMRELQMQELIATFADYPYVIICADWNVNSASEYERFTNAGYRVANHGYLGDIPTHPAGAEPLQYYDNIVCKGFAINGINIINDETLSDHCCIYADFTLIR